MCGAAGGFVKAVRAKRSVKVIFFELFGGIITANILSPIIADYAPESWHHTLFF